MYVPFPADYVNFAEVVIVGQIENYHVVSKVGEVRPNNYSLNMSDQARFNVHITEALKGEVSGVIPVSWSNPTSQEPAAVDAGGYLFALMKPGSDLPPTGGSTGIRFPPPNHETFTVVPVGCSGDFIIRTGTPTEYEIRKLLVGK